MPDSSPSPNQNSAEAVPRHGTPTPAVMQPLAGQSRTGEDQPGRSGKGATTAKKVAKVGAVAGGCLLVLTAAAALGFGPMVRKVARNRAERQALTLTIGSVRPRWLGVSLRDVQVGLKHAPDVQIKLAQVTIDSTWTGQLVKAHGEGGSIDIKGDRATIAAQLARWQAARASVARGGKTGGGAGSRQLSVAGLKLRWQGAARGLTQPLEASGVGLSRTPGKAQWQLTLTKASAESAEGSLEVAGAAISFARRPKPKLYGFKLESLKLSLGKSLPLPMPPAAPRPTTSVSAAKPLPKPPRRRRGRRRRQPIEPYVPAPHGRRLVALLGRLRVGSEALRAYVAKGAPLQVRSFEFSMPTRSGPLHLGPNQVNLKLGSRASELQLLPDPNKAVRGPTLMLKASLPRKPGPANLHLGGGPVPLAQLGLREGNLSLVDLQKAKLNGQADITIAADGSQIDASGSLRFQGLSIAHKKIAAKTIRGLSVGVDGKVHIRADLSEVHLEPTQIEVGKTAFKLSGDYFRTGAKHFKTAGKFAIPLASCGDAISSLPAELIPNVAGAKLSGTFSLKGGLRFNSQTPGKADIRFTLLNQCRFNSVPSKIDVRRFRDSFRRTVYDAKKNPVEIDSGPGTPGWVPYGGISPFMDAAVLTTEDRRFRRHQGFDFEAIRNSIRENLKAKRFVRGASTISMQTAKNLYLTREKTISRKLEEAILTAYLEQSLSKRGIMELYLNSIEFGPMIYGIGPAANHYFHTSPSNLSLSQALYLASILPNPKRQHFGAGGKVTPGWTKYLRRLMKIMLKRGLISDTQLEDGLRERVVFGRPNPEIEEDETEERTDPTGEGDERRRPVDPGPFPAPRRF